MRTQLLEATGVLTSIRLENMVWDILAEMAEAEGCTTNMLIVRFHDEILAHRGEVPNLASFLRVTCMRRATRSNTVERLYFEKSWPVRTRNWARIRRSSSSSKLRMSGTDALSLI